MKKINFFEACHCEKQAKQSRRLPRQKTARNDKRRQAGIAGFTMVELLVAMVILVIAFGLVTFLYTKAAKIRKTVVINSEIQQVLSQMTDILTYGERNSWGLIDAVGLDDTATLDTKIVAQNADGETLTAEIKTVEDLLTLQITKNSTSYVIDVNKKVQLFDAAPTRSRFEYFDDRGNCLTATYGKTTLVKITLWARSTDPSFKNAPLVPFVTAVRLHNKNPL